MNEIRWLFLYEVQFPMWGIQLWCTLGFNSNKQIGWGRLTNGLLQAVAGNQGRISFRETSRGWSSEKMRCDLRNGESQTRPFSENKYFRPGKRQICRLRSTEEGITIRRQTLLGFIGNSSQSVQTKKLIIERTYFEQNIHLYFERPIAFWKENIENDLRCLCLYLSQFIFVTLFPFKLDEHSEIISGKIRYRFWRLFLKNS